MCNGTPFTDEKISPRVGIELKVGLYKCLKEMSFSTLLQYIKRITVLNIVIWGGKSSVLWSHILFTAKRWFYDRKFRFTAKRQRSHINAICDRRTDDLPLQTTIFITVMPM